MPSKVKILPSDVLLLIIDYLDSPSMMNCREVCKSWLDVVDSNHSLWNYFYDTSLSYRATTSNMLNLFSIRCSHSLKAFSIIQRERGTVRAPDQRDATLKARLARQRQDANTILDILFRSKESLRLFAYSEGPPDYVLMKRTLDESAQFPNLKSISFHSHGREERRALIKFKQIQVNDDVFQSSTTSQNSLTKLLIQEPWGAAASQLATLIKVSQSTLLHLQNRGKGLENENLTFSKLQALDFAWYMNKFPSTWHCPRLRVLILSLMRGGEKTTIDCFPPSVEYLWLKTALGGTLPVLKRGGLDNLKKGNPRLEVLRIDRDIEFIPKGVVKMVKARIAAAKKGLEVEGLKMRSMKQLILDFSRLDSPTLSKLQELVPEVIDVRTVSNELIIDCEVVSGLN